MTKVSKKANPIRYSGYVITRNGFLKFWIAIDNLIPIIRSITKEKAILSKIMMKKSRKIFMVFPPLKVVLCDDELDIIGVRVFLNSYIKNASPLVNFSNPYFFMQQR